jgi:hypothetical protein
VVVLARAVAPLTGAGSDRVAQVAALPTMHFPNGHIFFTARLPQREGIKPYAVHCTYQYSGTPGKRSRFRCVRFIISYTTGPTA